MIKQIIVALILYVTATVVVAGPNEWTKNWFQLAKQSDGSNVAVDFNTIKVTPPLVDVWVKFEPLEILLTDIKDQTISYNMLEVRLVFNCEKPTFTVKQEVFYLHGQFVADSGPQDITEQVVPGSSGNEILNRFCVYE